MIDQPTRDRICELLADGMSLREVCKQEGMPNRSTVFRAIAVDAEFRDQYARAREAGLEALADDIVAISDDDTRDWEPVRDSEGQIVDIKVDGEHVTRSKLKVDTRKWLLSKLVPKKYGDKVMTEVTGADGGPVESVTRIELVPLSPK